jgi:hypothetical protein
LNRSHSRALAQPAAPLRESRHDSGCGRGKDGDERIEESEEVGTHLMAVIGVI